MIARTKYQAGDIELGTLLGQRPPHSQRKDLTDALPKARPGFAKVRFEAMRWKEDAAQRKMVLILEKFRAKWNKQAAALARNSTIDSIHLLSLHPDQEAISAVKMGFHHALAWARAEVYRERYKATGRKASEPPQHLKHRLADAKPLAARPAYDMDLVAKSTVADAQRSISERARSAFIDETKDGFEGDELEELVEDALEDMSANAFLAAAREGARQIIFEGRMQAYKELDSEIRIYVRREQDDDKTCDACHQGDGDEWDSIDDVDWRRGDDCEGGDNCRGDLLSIFSDESDLVSEGGDEGEPIDE